MSFPFFKGKGTSLESKINPLHLPPSRYTEEAKSEYYIASEELANAVNVALLVGKPLLITGEPGTGKTQLAYRIAHEFDMAVFKFETKSTSQASDLFYYFNMVGFFQAAQLQLPSEPKEFIHYNALGKAIIMANPHSRVKDILPSHMAYKKQQRSVVLIDEIDKAPIDFPNDILSELEELYFRIPELRVNRIGIEKDNKEYAPVVVITSNLEKSLPEPFLRRCIYHHIEFPSDPEVLEQIVLNRLLTNHRNDPLLADMTGFFLFLRGKKALIRNPSIGELITWVNAMFDIPQYRQKRSLEWDMLQSTIGTLCKHKDDQKAALIFFNEWPENIT
ncbi:MAG: MoxR family ATPase [Lewinellaceae bacterium]|nr:MoxR family ATPase [Phaeodactylibacter sp.]MCB9352101.1 MoxR family ATPase [Lewinellaceae bacterium]